MKQPERRPKSIGAVGKQRLHSKEKKEGEQSKPFTNGDEDNNNYNNNNKTNDNNDNDMSIMITTKK